MPLDYVQNFVIISFAYIDIYIIVCISMVQRLLTTEYRHEA